MIAGKPDDPMLPAGKLDAVLIVDSYHEFEAYPAMLRRIRAALKPAGRLVIVDRAPPPSASGKVRKEQVRGHSIDRELVEGELIEAGFRVMERSELTSAGAPDQGNASWVLAAEPEQASESPQRASGSIRLK